MDRYGQHSRGILEGITPHSCEFCWKISIDPDQCANEAYLGSPHRVSWRFVCEATFNGCPMFRRRLEWAYRILSRREPSAALPSSLVITPWLLGGEAYLKFEWIDDNGGNADPVSDDSDMDRRIFALAGTLA